MKAGNELVRCGSLAKQVGSDRLAEAIQGDEGIGVAPVDTSQLFRNPNTGALGEYGYDSSLLIARKGVHS